MNTIWVNEKQMEVDFNIDICQLLLQIKSPTNGIAVAINNKICSQINWQSTILKNNDKILIIQATQGG